MFKPAGVLNFRSLLCGVIVAVLGASYAIATSATPDSRGIESLSRGVGSGLRFSTPFLLAGSDSQFPGGGDLAADPDGYDLGDACFGSQVVRYITALGGVQPYRFTSQDINTGGSVGLALGRNGRVSGLANGVGTAVASFTALLTDASGATRTGIFRLRISQCVFRFAHDRLAGAQVGLDYITNIAVIGAPGPATFSVVPGTLAFNGAPQTDMETLGLRLFNDGTIAGRPLQSGTLTFTARAIAGNLVARDRSNSQQDQPLTITINAQTSIQSVLATTRASIRGDFVRANKDTFELQANINTDGLTPFDFRDQVFTVRFLGATFATQLDGAGQQRKGDLRVGIKAPSGQLRVRLKNINLGSLLSSASITDRGTKVVVVQVQIGNDFLGTEPIEFATQNRKGKFRMAYSLGKQRQIGGLFQIVKLTGIEIFQGTAFKVRFHVSPVNLPLTSANMATVNIGQNFTDTEQLFGSQGKFAPPGIRSLKINSKKLTGDLTTYELTPAQTGIALPSQGGGQPQTFLFGLRLETTSGTFFGETSRRILPFVIR